MNTPVLSVVAAMASDPVADEERRRALRRMRTIAVALLLLAALTYLITLDRQGWLGFVNAAAEAAMVGAIADWFAVTALFRHPLGIPIPHTALIPRRKDELGRGLEQFVGENFLREEIIRDRVKAAQVSARFGSWLAEPAHLNRAVTELSHLAASGLNRVRDEHVADLITQALVPRFRDEPIAPLLGGLLGEVVRDGVHHSLVDLTLTELADWLGENEETFTDLLTDRAPWWAPQRLNEAVTGRLYLESQRWLAEVRDDPHHQAREALDSMLARLAEDLLNDPATQRRAEDLKQRVLDHPAVLDTAVSLWNGLRAALLGSLRDPNGAVNQRLGVELAAFGARLREEPQLRARLDSLGADAAVFAVERYGAEVTAIITHTIQQWDGHEAAKRIELHVGRDLQFIRINGTIVGGLVGLLIHTVAVLIN